MTGYVAGDGAVTGISAHSSPTRQSNFCVDSRFPIHYYTRAPCENPTNLDNDSCGCEVLARCIFFWGGRPQISGPFTTIRKENTKWMDLVLERVESPGSQAHSSRSGVAWSHAVGVWF